MRIYLDNPVSGAMPWRFLCIFALLLFLTAVAMIALLIQQRRHRWLWLGLPVALLSYFLVQCFVMACLGYAYSQTGFEVLSAVVKLPGWLLLGVLFALALAELILMRSIYLREKNSITPMSVKEAVDSLPDGILCYAPGAKVLLANHTMQDFCRKTTGAELEDGASFRERLLEGELLADCERLSLGSDTVIVLPDGTARKISESEIPYEKHTVRMLLALNITEAYRKNQELAQMQEKVERLGKRLQKVNREIVALTAEREVLNAKVKIHDELGSNLLAIKRYLVNGGTEEEKAELMKSLHRSVSFLKTDRPSEPVRDEYELLQSMAARLGLTISVTGELPQTEPHKPIIATAIHECFTNTLRHAHGDELHIELSEDDEWVTAIFTNNGDQPGDEITEKGGLKSLRELTEQAGGSMTAKTQPAFTLTIRLPKEVEDAL